jgi:hypothetical protein
MNEFNRYFKGLPFLAPFLLTIVAGIVGNRADAIFLISLSLAGREIPIKVGILAFLLGLALLPSTLAAVKYYRVNKISENLIELDESVLRLLASFKRNFNSSGFSIFRNSNSGAQEALKRLVEELLEKALEVFYLFHTCGIEVWMPESENSEYLKLWYQANLSDSARARVRFYIGAEEGKEEPYLPGLAGATFRDKKIRIVHIFREKGEWRADSPDYVFVNDRQRAKRFPYRTLIAVPMLTLSSPGVEKCLGVLCMYSLEKNAFDSKRVESLVASIADRIASVLIITESRKP